MAQTKLGALKTAAKKAGVDTHTYAAKVEAGEKFCYACADWKPVADYPKDASRHDGLGALCRSCRSSKCKAAYQPKDRKTGPRGFFVATRDGDKKQARRRVNYLVEQGRIPHPNEVPCLDCCHVFDGTKRHEYDHARGYDGENQLYVESVCTDCHAKREAHRGVRFRAKNREVANG